MLLFPESTFELAAWRFIGAEDSGHAPAEGVFFFLFKIYHLHQQLRSGLCRICLFIYFLLLGIRGIFCHVLLFDLVVLSRRDGVTGWAYCVCYMLMGVRPI